MTTVLQACKLLSSHPFKPFPRQFSGPVSWQRRSGSITQRCRTDPRHGVLCN